MKRIFLLILPLLLLTGCNESAHNMQSSELSQDKTQMIENACTAYDISDLLTKTADYTVYSECEESEIFTMYFDLLGTNEYFVVNHNDENYVLFYCFHSGYGEKISAITNMKKTYNASTLSISIDKEISYTESLGCEPDYSYIKCIIKTESEISELVVDDVSYSKYDGGYIQSERLWGVVDENLNIIVPIKYNIIRQFDTYKSDSIYYYMTTDKGMGLMDSEFKVLLQPLYNNIYYVDDNKFVVEKGPRGEIEPNEQQTGIVDRNGNLIHEYIDGFINGSGSFNNDVNQAVFSRVDGDAYFEGVIDSDLNIIIEPIYMRVATFEISAQKDLFYVVENENEEYAIINSAGKQQTEFEKTSVYDVQTKYYEFLRSSSN